MNPIHSTRDLAPDPLPISLLDMIKMPKRLSDFNQVFVLLCLGHRTGSDGPKVRGGTRAGGTQVQDQEGKRAHPFEGLVAGPDHRRKTPVTL